MCVINCKFQVIRCSCSNSKKASKMLIAIKFFFFVFLVAQVSFMQTEYSVTEGGQVVITISLAGAVDSPAVVK